MRGFCASAVLTVGLLISTGSASGAAQPPSAPDRDVLSQPATPLTTDTPDRLPPDETTRLEQMIADRYAARLDALAIEKRTFEWTVWIFTTLITLLAVTAAVVAYRFGKSFKELSDSVRLDAAATFRAEFFNKADQLEGVARLKKAYEEAHASLEVITRELQGYSALAAAAERASGFDPLVEYLSMSREIGVRYDKTRPMVSGDDSIAVSETTYDREFRQRAAIVFERLLAAVRSGQAKGSTPKVGPDMLFNAAADASKANLDFVSLQLMEAASLMSDGQAPEIESRYIRQQLKMSVITASEARSRISEVLRRTSAFDVHLAVSEAFNIGIGMAEPSEMADLIEASLPAPVAALSYAKLNGARLKLMGSTLTQWEEAKKHYCEGLRAFATESPTVRWYHHSAEELGKILEDRPDFIDAGGLPLRTVLGISPSVAAFAQKFGLGLTNSLNRAGLLGDVVTHH